MMIQIIEKAKLFAQSAHSGQFYDEEPYITHLEAVYNELVNFGFDANNGEEQPILIAGWLHDVIENTDTSYTDLKNIFGEEVAEIVYCVTDELGRNRKEKKERTYAKIRSNAKAIIVKIADRIANVRHSVGSLKNQNFRSMYQKEHLDFVKNLKIYRHVPEMWKTLNDLIIVNS